MFSGSDGLCGLANVGNTCYLNSCMQVLSQTTELTALLQHKNGAYKQRLNRLPESFVLLEWDKLRQQLWQQPLGKVVVPHDFVKTIQRVATIKKRELFAGYAQNDVQEFLLFLVDCFHSALQREVEMVIKGTEENATDKLATVCYTMMQTMYKKEYSEMLNIFYGIHVSEITDAVGTPLSLSAEPFSILSLSIPPDLKLPNLFDCLDLYCRKEQLEGPNMWFNETTGSKQVAQRGILFWSLPNILIIDLKRWHGGGQGQGSRKNQILVSMPLSNVNLAPYVRGYNPESYVYDLYGICNHSGNVLGGHYTAYVKNATNNSWYSYNDTLVTHIPADKIITPYAYCFFYRKQDRSTIS